MSTHQIDISEFEKDPRLFLFTSLTAGSSHIITATSRMETILKANKIPFQAIDLATDEKARRLWQRRARDKKLPGLVREGFVLGDLEEVEEWNEFGELKENIGDVPASGSSAGNTVKTGVNIAPPIPINPTATQGTTNISQPPVNKAPKPGVDENKFVALPGAAEIAARNKKPTPEQQEGKSVIDENVPPKTAETMTSAPAEKEESINAAKKLLGEKEGRGVEHLSAPPSAMQSGTATPEPEKAAEGNEGEASEERGEEEKLAPESSKEAEEEKLTHRGSEIKDVPNEEIQKIESDNALAEAAEEEDGGAETAVKDTPEATAATAEAPDASEGNAAEVTEEKAAETKDQAAEVTEKAAETKVEAAEAKDQTTKADDQPQEEAQEAAGKVEASDAGEGKTAEEVKEQSAKEPEDAGKTVGD